MFRNFTDDDGGGSMTLTRGRSHITIDSFHVKGERIGLAVYNSVNAHQLLTHYMLNVSMKGEIKDIYKHLKISR